MKKILWVCTTALLASCASTTDALNKARGIDYGKKPADSLVISQMAGKIRPTLKDPSSLKNLVIGRSFKCYASKTGFSDNVSPKYDYGYWCYQLAYQATNSYGGYVTGTAKGVFAHGRMMSVEQLGDIIRKHDDVYTYWQSNIK